MPRLLTLFFFVALLVASQQSISQSRDTTIFHFNNKRLGLVVSSEVVCYAGLMTGLNELWYKGYPRSPFHFFNDNNEWLQMDKIGHATTSYYTGLVGMKLLNWCGVERKKSILLGGGLGLMFLTSVEVLDGLSSQWGFSVGDMAANTAGYLLLVGQQLAWNEQRVLLKFSYQPSSFAKYRPNVLGSNFSESLLKDYNGQTYWLSCNIASFLSKQTKFPKWLNVALGYGANGMIGGTSNPSRDKNGNTYPFFNRYRQYYLSLDIDLTRIKTKYNFLNTALKTIGFIKFPLPGLEYNSQQRFTFRPICF